MAGYTRQSDTSIIPTGVVKAGPINAEYDKIETAFARDVTGVTGHKHDGTADEGSYVPLIADIDKKNHISVDQTNNRHGIFVEVSTNPVEQVRFQDGVIVPVTDNDIDLGSASVEYKNVYVDGTAFIDTVSIGDNDFTTITDNEYDVSSGNLTFDVAGDIVLDADGGDVTLKDGGTAYATFTNTSGNLILKSGTTTAATFTGANVDFAGTVDVTGATVLDSNLTVAGVSTFNGNTVIGNAASDTVTITADVASDLIPSADNTHDLGGNGTEWKDLWIDGTAHIDVLEVDESATVGTTLTVAGVTALNGGLTMDSNKFTVANTSGNTAIAGTLAVTGNATAAGTLGVTGNTTVGGTFGATGNTALGGTLAVTGTSAFTGAITANAGVVVDNITIDGTEIDLSSGDLTVDVAGDIYLNADGANIVLQDGSATFGSLNNSGGNLVIKSGTTTAATFAGANVDFAGTVDVTGAFTADSTVAVAGVLSPATHVDMPDNAIIKVGTGDDLEISHDGTNSFIANKTGALKIATETSGIAITIGHGTSEVTIGDNLTVAGNLTVTGTQTVVDTVTMNAANAIVFEGATADEHETTLTIIDPTADRTINLPNQSGTIPVLAAASNTAITATPAELSIIDGDTSASSTTLADADRVVVNDAGTMKQVALTDFETYMETSLDTLANVTTVGALNTGSITSGFGTIDTGSSAITTTGAVNFGSLNDGTIGVTAFVDEDNMASNSATLVPTQQSVKAYVDTIAGQSNNVVGLTSSAAELNILDDATLTTAELNILDGSATTQATVTLVGTDGVVISDADVMKQALVSDFDTYMASTSKTLTNKTLTSPVLNGTIVVSDGTNDLNIASHDGSNGLKLGGTLVTSTAAELNILTGVNTTASELNLIDGDTSRGTTAVASGDGILINDAGTMRMTNVDTVSTYFAGHNVGGANIVTTGALNSGSITSGFGTIDTGASAITTTGLVSGGSLDIDSVLINGATIGHTDDTDLITLANGLVTVAGEVSMTTLDIGGTNVTATAAEINYLDIATLGTSAASKVVTSDANNVVTFSGGIVEDSVTVSSSSAALTLDMRLGTNFIVDLTENITSTTFSNPAGSGNVSAFSLKVIQGSTARTIAWPSAVDWPAATAPTLTTTDNGVDMFVFQTMDGGTTWYGFVAGQALA